MSCPNPACSTRPVPSIRRTLARFALSFAAVLSPPAIADPIVVLNGDFSAVGNVGSVGGVIGNGTNVPIGSGPWTATFFGPVGLLPPTLAISNTTQTATISGLLGLNIGGLLNNGGWFSQTLPTPWETGRFYVLSANIDAGTALDLSLLDNVDVGIALRRADGTVLASSNLALPGLVRLDLLTSTQYRLRFGYFADGLATGNINVALFNTPVGLLTANLLGSTTFANVELEVRDIGAPAAVEVMTYGDLLQAQVGQPFGEPIIALVRDDDGDGVPGVTVTFTAPSSGASATLSSPTGGTGLVVTAVTDLDGLAVVYAQANNQAGCYRVHAEATAFTLDQAVFHLRNWSDDPGQDSIYCNGYQ